jgi:hypothetical protein
MEKAEKARLRSLIIEENHLPSSLPRLVAQIFMPRGAVVVEIVGQFDGERDQRTDRRRFLPPRLPTTCGHSCLLI